MGCATQTLERKTSNNMNDDKNKKQQESSTLTLSEELQSNQRSIPICGTTNLENTTNIQHQNNSQQDQGAKTIYQNQVNDAQIISMIGQLAECVDSGEEEGKFEAFKFLTDHVFDVKYSRPIIIFRKIIYLFGDTMQGMDLREVRQICYITTFMLFQVYIANHEEKKAPIPKDTRDEWTTSVKSIKNLIFKTDNEQNGLEFLIGVLLDGISLLIPGQVDKTNVALDFAKGIFGAAVGVATGDYSAIIDLGKLVATELVSELVEELTEPTYIQIMGLQYMGYKFTINGDRKILEKISETIYKYLHSNWRIAYSGIESLQYILENLGKGGSDQDSEILCRNTKLMILQEQVQQQTKSNSILCNISSIIKQFMQPKQKISNEWRIQEKIAELLLINECEQIQSDESVRKSNNMLYEALIKLQLNKKVCSTLYNPNYVTKMKLILQQSWKAPESESAANSKNIQQLTDVVVGGDIFNIYKRIKQKQLAELQQYQDVLNLYVSEKAVQRAEDLQIAEKRTNGSIYILNFSNEWKIYQEAIHKQEDINQFDVKTLLIQGEAGTGKSILLQWLRMDLLKNPQKYQFDKFPKSDSLPEYPLTMYVNLAQLKDPISNLMEESLVHQNLIQNEITTIKRSKIPIIILLDGFDELNQMKNLISTNNLDQWNCAIIISCRTEYLQTNKQYRDLFVKNVKSQQKYENLMEMFLVTFEKSQIDNYIEKFCSQNQQRIQSAEYKELINTIPGISKLVENPYILSMVLSIFPQLKFIANEHKSKKISKMELFEIFIQQWFQRENTKINQNTTIQSSCNFEDEFRQFCQLLAIEMVLHKTYAVGNKNIKLINRDLQPYFSGKNDEENQVRKACPLRCSSNLLYSFIHKSLCEFFAACSLIDSVLYIIKEIEKNINYSFKDDFSAINMALIEDLGVWGFLIEYTKSSSEFRDNLLAIVDFSKRSQFITIAASNAITLLNYAHCTNFGKKDFSNVRICNANLSRTYLGDINFSGADLTGVNLSLSYLQNAIFDNANLKDVQFGELFSLHGLDSDVQCVSYSPTLPLIAAGGGDNGRQVKVWNIETGELKYCQQYKQEIQCIKFSKNSEYIVIGSAYAPIQFWELKTNKILFELPSTIIIYCCDFSKDGKLFAAAGSNGEVQLWDLNKRELISKLVGHQKNIFNMKFNNKRNQLITGGQDKEVIIWDILTCTKFQSILGDGSSIEGLDLDNEEERIAIGNRNGKISIWSADGSRQLHVMEDNAALIPLSVQFSTDGKILASGYEDGTIVLWNIEQENQVSYLNQDTAVFNIRFNPNGVQFATGGKKRVNLYNINQQSQLNILQEEIGIVQKIQFGSDNYNLVSISRKNTECQECDIKILEALSGQQKNILCHQQISKSYNVSYNSKDEKIFFINNEQKVMLWNLTDGDTIITNDQQLKYVNVRYNPQQNLTYISQCGRIEILDNMNMKIIRVIQDQQIVNLNLFQCWQSNDKLLFADQDRYVVYNINSGEIIETVILSEDYNQMIYSYDISNDLRYFAAGGHNKMITIWENTSFGKTQQTICNSNERQWNVVNIIGNRILSVSNSRFSNPINLVRDYRLMLLQKGANFYETFHHNSRLYLKQALALHENYVIERVDYIEKKIEKHKLEINSILQHSMEQNQSIASKLVNLTNSMSQLKNTEILKLSKKSDANLIVSDFIEQNSNSTNDQNLLQYFKQVCVHLFELQYKSNESEFIDFMYKFCSQFAVTKPNGQIYAGMIQNGVLHGYGMKLLLDGEQQIGEFKNNKISGQGRWIQKDECVLEGLFSNNILSGTITLKDKTIFEGQFNLSNNNYVWSGKRKKGDTEEVGLFQGDLFGQCEFLGNMTYKNYQNIYVKTIMNAIKLKAQYLSMDENWVQAEFEKQTSQYCVVQKKMTQTVTCYGMIANNIINGNGMKYYNDNHYEVGEFIDDVLNGYGILIQDEQRKEGYFVFGQLCGDGKIIQNNVQLSGYLNCTNSEYQFWYGNRQYSDGKIQTGLFKSFKYQYGAMQFIADKSMVDYFSKEYNQIVEFAEIFCKRENKSDQWRSDMLLTLQKKFTAAMYQYTDITLFGVIMFDRLWGFGLKQYRNKLTLLYYQTGFNTVGFKTVILKSGERFQGVQDTEWEFEQCEGALTTKEGEVWSGRFGSFKYNKDNEYFNLKLSGKYQIQTKYKCTYRGEFSGSRGENGVFQGAFEGEMVKSDGEIVQIKRGEWGSIVEGEGKEGDGGGKGEERKEEEKKEAGEKKEEEKKKQEE